MENKQERDYSRIKASSAKAFDKLQEYLLAEINSSGEDLLLLENLNLAAKTNFDKLSTEAQNSLAQATKIQQTYKQLELYLSQTDTIVSQVEDLELLANELDSYSKTLEHKFSQFLG
ncbi:Biogenesis of lysosome-related organelles complex 1 subunit 2 [Smittium culicis]|uniref:Biogenesis of lysosome-related organelles complex 1 subunit 2 n=1 Tax=Smittium culicis TaxID=133412 RepID=A0A1R1YI36_9FUNG|nr:Biogenesis of lysosome-related organelles complex 1 subunit 2 [Smittium culicis]